MDRVAEWKRFILANFRISHLILGHGTILAMTPVSTERDRKIAALLFTLSSIAGLLLVFGAPPLFFMYFASLGQGCVLLSPLLFLAVFILIGILSGIFLLKSAKTGYRILWIGTLIALILFKPALYMICALALEFLLRATI